MSKKIFYNSKDWRQKYSAFALELLIIICNFAKSNYEDLRDEQLNDDIQVVERGEKYPPHFAML